MQTVRICALLAALSVIAPTTAYPETLRFAGACDAGPELTIAAAGDLLFHRRVQRLAYASPIGAQSLFSPQMRKLIAAADLAYANFEGPAAHGVAGFGRRVRDPGPRVDQNVYDGYPAFNYHPSVISGLRKVGFDIVSTANNHSLDRGAIGVTRTAHNMTKRGLAFMGTRQKRVSNGPPAFGDWSRIIKRQDFTTAWIACAEMTNGLPDRERQVLMCHRDRKTIMRELNRLQNKKSIDAVFLTPHWGEENQHRPQRRHRSYARAAIEAGATAVIGTHPHVVQPWEKVTTESGREGLAIYSTGNFISGQIRPMQRTGILALLRIVKPEGERARLASAGYIPSWVSFAGGRRVVTANTGREGGKYPLKQTKRLLPPGNAIAASLPFQMPNECRKTPAAAFLTAALSRGRHPGMPGERKTLKRLTNVAQRASRSGRRTQRTASSRTSRPKYVRHADPFRSTK